jgi:hypothetical protein
MSKPSTTSDWTKSPAYIDLLEKFQNPRDVNQVLGWDYLKEALKESPKAAIQRLIDGGYLEPATLEEAIDRLSTQAQLKPILKELGEKQTGSKQEMVSRVIAASPQAAQKLIAKSKVMKCTEIALQLLASIREQKEKAYDDAFKKSFDAFSNNNPKEAYRSYVAYQREYVNIDFQSNSYEVEELQSIFEYLPEVLNELSPQDIASIRTAAAMSELWDTNVVDTILPEGLSDSALTAQLAINYILKGASIWSDIRRNKEHAGSFSIEFFEGDVDSCELCLAHRNKKYKAGDIPKFPLKGCSSTVGCCLRVNAEYDADLDDEYEEDEDIEDDDIGEDESMPDAVVAVSSLDKLRQLNQMLDEGLITDDEYQTTKQKILSNM